MSDETNSLPAELLKALDSLKREKYALKAENAHLRDLLAERGAKNPAPPPEEHPEDDVPF